MADEAPGPRISRARVVFGLMVMLAGSIAFIDRLDWWGFDLNVPVWPWVLILLGLARVSVRRAEGRAGISRPGAWLILVGSWGLVSELHLGGLTYATSWPLLLIGAGGMMIWRSFDPTPKRCRRPGR